MPARKEEKEYQGKNNCVKNDVERFTRVQQDLVPIWLLKSIFVTVVTYKSLSHQMLQTLIIFLSTVAL